MRSTVYVPDELWEQVKEAHPTQGASELVQHALREFIQSREATPEWAQERPVVDVERMERIRHHLLDGARQSYKSGYGHGLRVGEVVPWWALDRLARLGWDVARWKRSTVLGHTQMDGKTYEVPLEVSLGMEELGLDETSVGLGFVHALRDLWGAVVRTQDPSTTHEDGEPT